MKNIEAIFSAVNEAAEAERQRFAPEPDVEPGAAPPSNDILEALEDNEDGDARLFIEYNMGRFLYDVAAGRWYVWHNNFWEKDILGEATRAIDGVIDLYAEEARKQSWRRLQNEKAAKTDEAKKHKNAEDKLLKRISH